jgi:hypothetical protein
MRRPKCTLEQMLEYYENEKDQEKSSPETELVKQDFTKQEHADMVSFFRALSGRELQHIMPSDSFPD